MKDTTAPFVTKKHRTASLPSTVKLSPLMTTPVRPLMMMVAFRAIFAASSITELILRALVSSVSVDTLLEVGAGVGCRVGRGVGAGVRVGSGVKDGSGVG